VQRQLVIHDRFFQLGVGVAGDPLVDERVVRVLEGRVRREAAMTEVDGTRDLDAVLGGLARMELVERDALRLRRRETGQQHAEQREDGQNTSVASSQHQPAQPEQEEHRSAAS
jgi:hypothetical protein